MTVTINVRRILFKLLAKTNMMKPIYVWTEGLNWGKKLVSTNEGKNRELKTKRVTSILLPVVRSNKDKKRES